MPHAFSPDMQTAESCVTVMPPVPILNQYISGASSHVSVQYLYLVPLRFLFHPATCPLLQPCHSIVVLDISRHSQCISQENGSPGSRDMYHRFIMKTSSLVSAATLLSFCLTTGQFARGEYGAFCFVDVPTKPNFGLQLQEIVPPPVQLPRGLLSRLSLAYQRQ